MENNNNNFIKKTQLLAYSKNYWKTTTLISWFIIIVLIGFLFVQNNVTTIKIVNPYTSNADYSVSFKDGVWRSNTTYLEKLVRSDVNLFSTFTISTIEEQNKLMKRRLAASVVSSMGNALDLQLQRIQKDKISQYFVFDNKILEKENRVMVSGSMKKFNSQLETYSGFYGYVIEYSFDSVTPLIIDIKGFNEKRALEFYFKNGITQEEDTKNKETK